MDLEKLVKQEKKRLEELIARMRKTISASPEGKLQAARHRGSYSYYYIKDNDPDKKRTYLKQDDVHFAQQLALKRHASVLLKLAETELTAINAYQKLHIPEEEQQKAYQKLIGPGIQRLLGGNDSAIVNTTETCSTWQNTNYEKLQAYPEQLIHATAKGDLVRSKSEVLIANALFSHNIPYRYECQILLSGKPFYPDFTIMHPATGRSFLWEHFGLMDQNTYRRHMMAKMEVYTASGYIPSINLICTYETNAAPLDSTYIDTLIRHHFQ